MDTWLRLLATGEPGEVEGRLRRFDGITVEDIVRLYAFEQGDLETLRRAVRVASLPKAGAIISDINSKSVAVSSW